MGRPKVFLTRAIPEKGLRLVEEFCNPDIWKLETPPPRTELISRIREVEGLLSLLTDTIDDEVMQAGARLKVISNCAAGVDNIDLAAATRRRIPIGNTPDVLTDATADMAFALLLAAARRVVEAVQYVKAGRWKTWNLELMLGVDVAGGTLGIVGFGRIGQAMAKRAQGFGMRVLFHDPSARADLGAQPVELDTLLRESDFVTLHVPLTADTRHMINKNTLNKMKPTAILVNTSRGPIVDHQALYEALGSHRIQAAGLDVTEPEPLNADHPLLKLDNCIVLPHLGSASQRTREQMAMLAAENLIAGLSGKRLPHCANPDVYGVDP